MPHIERIPVRVTTPKSAKTAHGEIEVVTLTGPDVRGKALRFSGTVLLLAVVMLPIPLIHLVAIPMGLLGPPIAFFAVFKLYGGSSETKGSAPCPSCGAAIDLTYQIDRWPLQEICPGCRESCVVDKSEK